MAGQLQEALNDIRRALIADGYEMTLQERPGDILQICIAAGPHACAECLLPKDVMLEIIQAGLGELSKTVGVELFYPGEQCA